MSYANEYRADRIVTQLLDLIEDLERVTLANEETIQAIDAAWGEDPERRAHLSGRINAIRGLIPRLEELTR